MKDAPIYQRNRKERECWEKKFLPDSPEKAVELLDLIAQPESPEWAIHALQCYILGRDDEQKEETMNESKEKAGLGALVAITGLLVALIGGVIWTLAGAASGVGLQVMIDGQPVGTLDGSGLIYDLNNGTIHIETAGGVFGCQLDRVFWDGFEER